MKDPSLILPLALFIVAALCFGWGATNRGGNEPSSVRLISTGLLLSVFAVILIVFKNLF